MVETPESSARHAARWGAVFCATIVCILLEIVRGGDGHIYIAAALVMLALSPEEER